MYTITVEEIDPATVRQFRAEIEAAFDAVVDAGEDTLDLDLARVTFIDSTGLSALIDAQRSVRRDGLRLRLHHVPPAVARVVELTSLTELFEVVEAAPAPPEGQR